MAPQHIKRLEALASLLKRDDLANLSSTTRAKVSSLLPTYQFYYYYTRFLPECKVRPQTSCGQQPG
jgi:hypothetical protein